MKAALIFASSLLCFTGISQACCPPFWSEFNGRCYRFVGIPFNWFQAREYCYHLSPGESHLVSLNSAIEAEYVHDIFQDSGAEMHSSYWIGLYDFSADYRSFKWDDGTHFWYSFWEAGEPNNNGDEYCGQVYRSKRWDDCGCTDIERPFFCEMKSN